MAQKVWRSTNCLIGGGAAGAAWRRGRSAAAGRRNGAAPGGGAEGRNAAAGGRGGAAGRIRAARKAGGLVGEGIGARRGSDCPTRRPPAIGMGASACVMSSTILRRAREGDVDARVYPTLAAVMPFDAARARRAWRDEPGWSECTHL